MDEVRQHIIAEGCKLDDRRSQVKGPRAGHTQARRTPHAVPAAAQAKQHGKGCLCIRGLAQREGRIVRVGQHRVRDENDAARVDVSDCFRFLFRDVEDLGINRALNAPFIHINRSHDRRQAKRFEHLFSTF